MPPDPAPSWSPEIEVSAPFAAELIAAQFPELAAEPVTVLATGWDNTAFAVGDHWLFRFPRREVVIPGVRREIAVLPRLAPVLPLPVPEPRFAGTPDRGYPWPFFGAPFIRGRELAEARLPMEQRTAAAVGLGRFLRVLHDPALIPLVADAGLQRDPLRRASPSFRAGMAREALGRLAARGTPLPDGLDGLLRTAAHAPDAAGDSVVCHGDLHLRHLLVGEDGAAAGVIDWGDLCLGDPAVDLVIAYLGFAGPARAALLAAYGRPVTTGSELAARTCAVFLAAALTEYAADQERPVLYDESLSALARAVA